MRAKKVRIIVGIITLSFMLVGCKSDYSYEIMQCIEAGRKQGYLETYIESANVITPIADEDFNQYLEAKKQYEDNNTMENFNALREISQKVYKELTK